MPALRRAAFFFNTNRVGESALPGLPPGELKIIFEIAQHLSSTPVRCSGIIRRRIADPLHGSLTPAAVLTEPPNAVTRSRREYHYPFGCRRHTGGLQLLRQDTFARHKGSSRFEPQGSCSRTPNLMYLMNDYLVVKVHAAKGFAGN